MKISQIPVSSASLIFKYCIDAAIAEEYDDSIIGTLKTLSNFLSLNSSDLVGETAEYKGGWPNYKAKCEAAFCLHVDQFSCYSHGPMIRLNHILWAFAQGTHCEAETELLPHLKRVPDAKFVLLELFNSNPPA
jgi:hypothetical protein